MSPVRVLSIGVHVLDVHVRHVDSIPEGSDGQVVDQIRMSPAGTAGGTAVVLSRLGADVHSAGAVGRDPLASVLLDLLRHHGVDTSRLVTRDDVQTSASVIPVRPNGDRPAWHCIGANGSFTLADLDLSDLGRYHVVHLGGPEFLGGDAAAEILRAARDQGAITSVDLLAPGDPDMLEWVGACLPHVDHLLPNDEQVLGFTGLDDVEAAATALLDRGPSCVAVTCGSRGAVVAGPGGVSLVPAFEVNVVDTTGCGDAFSAGYLLGVAGGRTPEQAAVLGNATAAQVAGGVGTDAGRYDLASVNEFAVRAATR